MTVSQQGPLPEHHCSGASMPLPRVILADDHTILLEALRELLEPYCEIVGTVADDCTLLETAPELKPDVIVSGGDELFLFLR